MVMAISSNLVCSSQQGKSTPKDAAFEKFTEMYVLCLEQAYKFNQEGHHYTCKGLEEYASKSFKNEVAKKKECSDILKYLEEIKKLK